MAGSFKSDTHWRDSGRHTRFWIFDAQACFPLLLCLLHIKLWTFTIAVIALVFFTYLNRRRGFTLTIFMRLVRSSLAGKRKVARPWWIYRPEE